MRPANTISSEQTDSEPRVVLFGLISKHEGRNRGGTSVSIARLAKFLDSQGVTVNIVCHETAVHQPAFDGLPSTIEITGLKGTTKLKLLYEIFFHIRRAQPTSLLSLDTRANQISCQLKRLRADVGRIYVSLRNSLDHGQSARPLQRWKRRRTLCSFFQHSDGVIAISHGLATQFSNMTGIPKSHLHVIHNLVVDDNIEGQFNAQSGHHWLDHKVAPIILSVGRLQGQKDFPTLIRSFALVHAHRNDVRLVILGEGSELDNLVELTRSAGIADVVSFPGFVPNPVSYMSRSDVFVLSSRYEGFGMVLAEALAAGCPVVSTDCPSGPREILADGAYGHLVPVGDVAAMAKAIETSLDQPLSPAILRSASQRFSEEVNGNRYMKLLVPERPTNAP